MIFHAYYAEVTAESVEDLLQSCAMGRLVTVSGAGHPTIGLYPYIRTPGGIELHLARADAQLEDLRGNDGCLFECDEILSPIPSRWARQGDASGADQYYRAVVLDCLGSVVEDPRALASHLSELLAKREGPTGAPPVAAGNPVYAGMMSRIALVRLAVRGMRVKFKLGQQEPDNIRRQIVAGLRDRATPLDRRTVDCVAATLRTPDD